MYDLVMADAICVLRKARGGADGPIVMRDVERQVMLRIIDQRWREHLEEMDYLQEGINLRAMGQKDPLTEWQREGYEMFGQMMKGIAQDFVKYVMHVQVVRNEAPAPAGAERAAVVQRRHAAAGERPDRRGEAAPAAASAGEIAADAGSRGSCRPRQAADRGERRMVQDADVTPPCPCGSGKKFKLCHGATG